jgi:branched-chain amino acid transport system substrate-binding protein
MRSADPPGRIGPNRATAERRLRFVGRRAPEVRTAAAAALALVLAAGPGPAVGAALGPVQIGLIVSLTGRVAQNGRDLVNGLSLALTEAGGTAAGREIHLLVEEDQNIPAQALTKARKLVELDHVDLLMGPISANSGYVIRDYVDDQKIPAVFPNVAGDDITQRNRTPWIVRTGWTSSQPNHPFGDYAAKVLRYRRIATIANDFAFGWESVGGFQRTFEEAGGRVVAHIWPPLVAPDYSPYLGRIPPNIDAVYAEFAGGDALHFLQQYREFGLQGRLPLIGGGTLTDESVLFEEGDLAKGVMTPLFYSPALNTQANRDFVRAYVRANGRVPSYYSEAGFTAMRFVLRGLAAVDGHPERREAFVAAMRAAVLLDAPRGPVRIDAFGNSIENIYIRRVDMVNGQPQNTVVYTYANVSQFWTFAPAAYLKAPVYTRDNPPAHP